MIDLAQGACAILDTAAPAEKVSRARALAEAWRDGRAAFTIPAQPPMRPARPERPLLLPPRDMPKRKAGGSAEKRIALLHALAHIELNAIDLAWDIIARFGTAEMPRAFFEDWVKVGEEEAVHFSLLQARLNQLDADYGDLPAHDGLWQAAEETAHDLLARLAIVPLVLEARGLDVTPDTIADFRRAGDDESAAILDRIYQDEIGHVAAGMRWFHHFADAAGLDPKQAWQERVRRHFRGTLKPPFNDAARSDAGFDPEFYRPLSA
ncbi:MAG: ferritin-like domain-containing protein [Dongiaceae bacterium]